jgi:ABC-type Na+ transport system ATPase subunit NatA
MIDMKMYFFNVAGMLEPTSGRVTVEGLDLGTNIQDVRKIIGFCPQYGNWGSIAQTFSLCDVSLDILYEDMSVEEHLTLVGRVSIRQERISKVEMDVVSLVRCVISTQHRWLSPTSTFCKSSVSSKIVRHSRRISRVE